ncbi:hypothetical protein COU60_05610 [Candidatus Pacearchaeota archaeon CG10_big_fil_rev_8_21_14_0_10_34_76]|nr:MAG: hypothetical protein COU60_05610 [Candidatus Pacearchaeota archaeon CG10_big_fil_rev_8_21_14_0_10_34_76]
MTKRIINYDKESEDSIGNAYDELTKMYALREIGRGTYAKQVLLLEEDGFDIPKDALEEIRKIEYQIENLVRKGVNESPVNKIIKENRSASKLQPSDLEFLTKQGRGAA